MSGGRLDTRLLSAPEALALERIRATHGLEHELVRDKSGVVGFGIVDRQLRLTTILDSELGPITVANAWLEHEGRHVRCQAPFRESESQAAYLGWHQDGQPFVYDSGSSIKHTLHEDDVHGPAPEAFWKHVAGAGAPEQGEGSHQQARAEAAFAAWCLAAARHGLSPATVKEQVEAFGLLLKPHMLKGTKLDTARAKRRRSPRKPPRRSSARAGAWR